MLVIDPTQVGAILASLIASALSSILSAVASNWIYTLFHLPSQFAL